MYVHCVNRLVTCAAARGSASCPLGCVAWDRMGHARHCWRHTSCPHCPCADGSSLALPTLGATRARPPSPCRAPSGPSPGHTRHHWDQGRSDRGADRGACVGAPCLGGETGGPAPSRPVIEHYPQDEDELTLLLWDSSIVCERLPGPLKLWEYETEVVCEYEAETPALRLVCTFIVTPLGWHGGQRRYEGSTAATRLPSCGLAARSRVPPDVPVPGQSWYSLVARGRSLTGSACRGASASVARCAPWSADHSPS